MAGGGAEGRAGEAVDLLGEVGRRALQGSDGATGQRLLGGQGPQLEVIVHGDVGSQHLQVQVLHGLETTEQVRRSVS